MSITRRVCLRFQLVKTWGRGYQALLDGSQAQRQGAYFRDVADDEAGGKIAVQPECL